MSVCAPCRRPCASDMRRSSGSISPAAPPPRPRMARTRPRRRRCGSRPGPGRASRWSCRCRPGPAPVATGHRSVANSRTSWAWPGFSSTPLATDSSNATSIALARRFGRPPRWRAAASDCCFGGQDLSGGVELGADRRVHRGAVAAAQLGRLVAPGRARRAGSTAAVPARRRPAPSTAPSTVSQRHCSRRGRPVRLRRARGTPASSRGRACTVASTGPRVLADPAPVSRHGGGRRGRGGGSRRGSIARHPPRPPSTAAASARHAARCSANERGSCLAWRVSSVAC